MQFNCSDQDWISFVLLEGSVAGCYPIYPHFRSFPEVFLHRPGYMYSHKDPDDAAWLILKTLDRDDLWTPEQTRSRAWIHERYDTSWLRMANVMGLTNEPTTDPYEEGQK